MAEGMQCTSARYAFSFGYFSLGMQRKVTRHQGEINRPNSGIMNIASYIAY
jgi:hypothetical protein